ncbi:glycosyltransferase family 4 protein [Ascidiimonas sp. W6]|uniref:glycosyltransferase family 4 protein n=1 Tax=Ascidiimonas meishanensis TaxID=3128903 RepID=UPI0030EDF60E
MKPQPLKILLFDGTFRTTAFINRLAEGLAQKNEVLIAGFNESITQKVPGVRYSGLGDNTYLLKFIRAGWVLSVKTLFKFGDVAQCFRFVLFLLQRKRKTLQQENLHKLIRLENPDIIHLQWVANLPMFEEIIRKKKHTVLLSQRGFHINVRPFVNEENKAYLQEWFPRLNGFHSVSKAIAAKSNAIWTSEHKKDVVVYSGLSLDKFPFRETYQKPSGTLELLSVGRNHWKKGYKYALIACKLLKDKGIAFQYTLLGVQENEELLYLRQELGLQEHVQFIAKVPQQEVYERMQKSHLLLLPSLEEGIANVAIEAMALGLPVISSRCGGMAELIDDEVTGWLTDIADPEGMARAVLAFVKKQDNVIAQVRIKARNKVNEQHTATRMITEMETLYRQLHETN